MLFFFLSIRAPARKRACASGAYAIMGGMKTKMLALACTAAALALGVVSPGTAPSADAERTLAALRAQADARIAEIRRTPNRAVPAGAPPRASGSGAVM